MKTFLRYKSEKESEKINKKKPKKNKRVEDPNYLTMT